MISEKLLIVNFGGPRTLEEIEPFLIALLTDRDVISSKMPNLLHHFFFTRIAKKRAKKIAFDYHLIGGKSPIFEDTEFIARTLAQHVHGDFLTFHRYLPSTHSAFISQIEQERDTSFLVFPLFPQFSYATTGSIARWLSDHLPTDVVQRMKWVKSYGDFPAYIHVMQTLIREFLIAQQLEESETILLFSAHGLPQIYIDEGDNYQKECHGSFEKIAANFPNALSHLSYQSKFGKGEWIRPYTDEFCKNLLMPRTGDKQVLFIPLSFTSDHIETLFEIEYQYLPLIRARGLQAYRLPALNRRPDWLVAISHILKEAPKFRTSELFRK